MAKLRFVGVGSAFAGPELGQSNMVIEADSGELLLIDCGQRAQDMLNDQYGEADDPSGLSRIDGIYISHLHADHIGGLEWLALCTYFNPNLGKPYLFCIEGLMHKLWEQSLRGGLSTLQVGEATLTSYFDCQPLQINSHFVWEGIRLTPVQTVHVVSGYRIMHCYGLMIEDNERIASIEKAAEKAEADLTGGDVLGGLMAIPDLVAAEKDKPIRRIFLTGDTQFAPKQLQDFYDQAAVILHDCETTPFRSNVHAHYNDLRSLDPEVKKRMMLYHYNTVPSLDDEIRMKEDGLAGFVKKGQTFDI